MGRRVAQRQTDLRVIDPVAGAGAVGGGLATGAHRMQIGTYEGDAGDLRRGGERAQQQVAQASVVVERDGALAQLAGQELDLVAGRAEMVVEVFDLTADAELGGLAEQFAGVATGHVERQKQDGGDGDGDEGAEAQHQHDRDRRPPVARLRWRCGHDVAAAAPIPL
jgi:hypothetical protein